MRYRYVLRKLESDAGYVLDYPTPGEALFFAIFEDTIAASFSCADYINLEERLLKVVDTLKEREKVVLICRFGFLGKFYTLDEVGSKFLWKTRALVSLIEQKALRKLRHPSRCNSIDPKKSKTSEVENVSVLSVSNKIANILKRRSAWSYDKMQEYIKSVACDQKMFETLEYYLKGKDITVSIQDCTARADVFKKYIDESPILIKTTSGYRERYSDEYANTDTNHITGRNIGNDIEEYLFDDDFDDFFDDWKDLDDMIQQVKYQFEVGKTYQTDEWYIGNPILYRVLERRPDAVCIETIVDIIEDLKFSYREWYNLHVENDMEYITLNSDFDKNQRLYAKNRYRDVGDDVLID